MKSFREGELVKASAIKMAEAFGEENMAKKFKTESLFHQTMARSAADLSQHLSSKLKTLIANVAISHLLWMKALM